MKKIHLVISLIVLLGFAVGCRQKGTSTSNPLIGVWKVIETTTLGTENKTENTYEHPSLFLFQDAYYSMVMILGDEPRAEFEDPWNPTDDEKVSAYNSILVNAGTYKLKDNVLITRPSIARVPNFVGGEAFYEYKIEEDILTLTLFDEVSKKGIPQTWVGKSKFQRTLIRIN